MNSTISQQQTMCFKCVGSETFALTIGSCKNQIVRVLNFLILSTLFLVSNQGLSRELPSIVDDIKADMLLNEAELMDAPDTWVAWSKGGFITMGAAARGDATPIWWQPDDKSYKSSDYWHAITPWFVIYPGTQHKANNVRVKISEIKLFILKRSSNTWEHINIDNTDPTWQHHQSHVSPQTAHEKVNKRTGPDGKISYKLNSGFNPIHGGVRKFEIYGPDVKAVYARLTSELIIDDPNKPDDRADAQILVSVGADYYPDINTTIRDFAPSSWVPAATISRFGLVKRTSRIHHAATIDPPGPTKNSGSVLQDEYKTIPMSEFENNPPIIRLNSDSMCP